MERQVTYWNGGVAGLLGASLGVIDMGYRSEEWECNDYNTASKQLLKSREIVE